MITAGNSRFHRLATSTLAVLSGCFLLAAGPCAAAGEKDKTEAAKTSAATAAEEAASRLQMHYYFKGRHIFEKQCVPCHGERGRGDGPWAEELTHKPRNFRSGVFKFRTTPYGKLPTDDDLRRTIRSGISGTAMPMFQKLSDSDVSGLIVYLKSFSRRWKDEELLADPLTLPETPQWFRHHDSVQKHASTGASKFAEVCSTCHGEKGRGDGPASKTLVDIWENPIVPADLTNEHHKSGDTPADLYRTIATGLDGTPMVGFSETLSEEEIWQLVAFIKSKQVEGQRAKEAASAAAKE